MCQPPAAAAAPTQSQQLPARSPPHAPPLGSRLQLCGRESAPPHTGRAAPAQPGACGWVPGSWVVPRWTPGCQARFAWTKKWGGEAARAPPCAELSVGPERVQGGASPIALLPREHAAVTHTHPTHPALTRGSPHPHTHPGGTGRAAGGAHCHLSGVAPDREWQPQSRASRSRADAPNWVCAIRFHLPSNRCEHPKPCNSLTSVTDSPVGSPSSRHPAS